MTYQLITTPTFDADTCLVIGYFEHHELPVKANDPGLKQCLKKLSHQGDVLWHQNTLLVHCGDEKKATLETLTPCLQALFTQLNQQKITKATLCLPRLKHI